MLPYQNSARDVFDGPEVYGEEEHHRNEDPDEAGAEHPAEQVDEEGAGPEADVAKAHHGVLSKNDNQHSN